MEFPGFILSALPYRWYFVHFIAWTLFLNYYLLFVKQNTYTKSHRNLCLSDLLVNSSCFGRTWTRVLHFHRVVRLIWIYYATVSLDILMFTRIVVHDIDFAIQNLCMIFLVYSFDLFSMIIFKMNYFREFKSETTTVCQHY